ncbi:NADPH-dependent assimilatory sulfite reductase flavoprotein subunit, partial [Escherichia coli]|nr:NADPH-dependent assimilatory sulfite reductase flavoprotein subunit [Escherichia coli]
LSGDEKIYLNGQENGLREALINSLEITQNTPHFVTGYAQLSANSALAERTTSAAAIQELIQTMPIVGVLQHYPCVLTAEQ